MIRAKHISFKSEVAGKLNGYNVQHNAEVRLFKIPSELMNFVNSIWGPFSEFPVYPSHILASYAKCQELSADKKE